ncbi:U8 snoRNA-decapping enzyme-like isoform X2 [Rhodnius prolixus]
MNHENLTDQDDGKLAFADEESDFDLVEDFGLNKNYKNCTHACHCMIFSKSNVPILDIYQSRSLILMQFRFDGFFGFPGGIVDPGESPEEALNRELSEELGLSSLVEFSKDDRVMVHYNKYKLLLLHFFLKEVSFDDFREIELRSMCAPEYGNEVLGTVRVPLYTMTDGYRGFPAFLQNKFIGNSRQQLLECLKILKIMNAEEIQKALTAFPLCHNK